MELTKEQIHTFYHIEELSASEIAEKYNCSPTTILRFMKLNNISRRQVGGYRKPTQVNKNNWKGYGNISGSYWRTILCRAKSKHITIDITIEYIWGLFLQQNILCALTGIPITFAKNYKSKNKTQQTASLDRINGNLGYIKGNVRWVHKDVNYIKQQYDDDYLYNICELIIQKRPI